MRGWLKLSLLLLLAQPPGGLGATGSSHTNLPQLSSSEGRTDSLASRAGEQAFHRAAALEDDASSALPREIYPGTSVPRSVMDFLISQRHRVQFHLPLHVKSGKEDLLEGKLRYNLITLPSPVSRITYDGTSYFLMPGYDLPDPGYPRWDQIFRRPAGVDGNAIQPLFISRVLHPDATGGRSEPAQRFELLSVRTTTAQEDKESFKEVFTKNKDVMNFAELLSKVDRGV
ncbi:uncharacterized protein UTRI_06209_B [Ustilago trichophora]|uniref:Uncharacterized protein n=1 Tax=Ustilago trichophora TaxID=86804 RepID=A0A5C3EIN9_9BASI|nr:uncharacterized protein UTRI_06209_B [Ustilago trichophora]